jgi:hypothetical protein
MRTAATVRAWLLVCACLGANVVFQRQCPPAAPDVDYLDDPPSLAMIRATTLGEDVLAGYLVTLYVQNFDVHLGRATPLAAIDRASVIRWFDLATSLDPGTGYPLLLAARHFAETGTPAQRRIMLDWVYQRFEEQPNQRWPWLVHALFVARHVLNDYSLAERYAAALRTQVSDPKAPSWVGQMELLLRADRGQAEDAKAILGALIAAGEIRSPAELRFLEARLAPMEHPDL